MPSSYEFQLSDYNRIMLRQFKFICIIVVIVAAVGLTIGLGMPKHYKATAVVQANFESFFEGTQVSAALTNQLEENLGSIMTDITSYRVLLKAAQRLTLIADTFSVSTLVHNQTALMTMERIRDMVSLTPVPASKRIEITVTSINPSEAVSLANAVSPAYRDFAYENKSSFFHNKEQRITETLQRCRNDLSTIAQRMVTTRSARQSLIDEAFYINQVKKSGNLEKIRQQIDFTLSSIQAQKGELFAICENLRRAHNRDNAGSGDSIDHFPDLSWIADLAKHDQGLFMLNGRLSELRDRRSGYLRFYTPRHPAVITINEQLLATINEIQAGLNRSAIALEQERATVAAHADTVDELLKRQLNDENTLEWMQRSYQAQEMTCESIEAELTEVKVILQGLVPYISIVAEAVLPSSPTGPGIAKIGVLSMAVGILLGVLLAIFREMADRSLSTIEDVRRVVIGYSVITIIPIAKIKKHFIRHADNSPEVFRRNFKTFLPVLFNRDTAQSESFNSFAAQLSMQNNHHECTAILVTSSIGQEGKTFIAVNLALALAQQGNRTTLIESDFRKPSAGSLFGLPPLQGLFHLLVDAATIDECRVGVADLLLGTFAWKDIVGMHGINNFSFIPYGALVRNPAELLASAAMKRLVKNLRNDSDYLVFDAPPAAAAFPDPIELARHCDGIIMVYRSDEASRDLLMSSIRRLEHTGTPVLGLALNAWHDDVGDGA
jgi:capsular exopolysaccharide synthesis family protein